LFQFNCFIARRSSVELIDLEIKLVHGFLMPFGSSTAADKATKERREKAL